MKLPDFSYEKKLRRKGFKFVAGVDEVGRGCFAGPIVAGCVVFDLENQDLFLDNQIKIDDSKKLSPKQRGRAEKWTKDNCLAWGIGEVGVGRINKSGMARAAKMAFRKAISEARKRLGKPIDFLLADAFFTPFVPGLPVSRRKNKKGKFLKAKGRQAAIVNGDEKSISIAAASIVAKVYRDQLMSKLSLRPKYKKYRWDLNKGYGTKEHQNAIKKYGTTMQHRKQFVETWRSKLESLA